MLLSEAKLYSAALPAHLRSVETVYIGGGTPSLLAPEMLSRLVTEIKKIFDLSSLCEFSIEANPGTVTRVWAETAAGLGINRVSLGMQAKQPAILHTLGRIHSFDDVRSSVRMLRSAGFSNLSLDLMFGIPGQSLTDWKESLESAVALNPEHISAYGLIPEEGTPLYRDLQNQKYFLPEPETEREMYDTALSVLLKNNYQQYEISNFARPGFACRHNIGYWTQVPYLGLGLSAASMFPEEKPVSMTAPDEISFGYPCLRFRNPSSFEEYGKLAQSESLSDSNAFRETEAVSAQDARFETMMLGLRMNAGVSESFFRRLHGVSMASVYGDRLHQLADQGLLEYDHGICRLTRKGMDLQNSVLVQLM